MASNLVRELVKRQAGSGFDDPNFENGNNDNGSWWWSSTGLAVRYAIVIAIFVLFLLYFVGGYWHARRRVRKGLAPLAYHRWMVARRASSRQMYYNPGSDYRQQPPYYSYNSYNASSTQPQQEAYPMYSYYRPAPPPAYNGAEAPPPVYQPPAGGSKVMADQGYFPVHQSAPTVGNAGQSSSNVGARGTMASGAH